MSTPTKKPPGQAWRTYPAKPAAAAMQKNVRLSDVDQFSTKPTTGTEKAAALLATPLPLKPPGISAPAGSCGVVGCALVIPHKHRESA